MDDWDIAREGISLLAGDEVSVTGRVDEDIFMGTAIEASAVYLPEFNTVYFASAADEEELGLSAVPLRMVRSGADYAGWVTGTSDTGFTLGSGPTLIGVDTTALATPLAESGVETGDRVYVWGDLDLASGGDSKLVAEGLVELRNRSSEGQNESPNARAEAAVSTETET